MIHLTIDGRPVDVEPGATVLEAARQLEIHIPTMCHVPGIEPASSCFVCAVQIEGRRGFAPSCAMPAAEGMVVVTNSDDVRHARKRALELLFSDHAGECEAPCAAHCPAGLDIPGFVYQIADGDTGRAMEIVTRRLAALPGSLGRVCPRLCEQNCRRCDLDQSLAIGAMHRYVADVDAASPTPYLPSCEAASVKRVAIIGAGPAGLSAAYYLLQKGHACTLFDAHQKAGGMLRYGIPAYRLPKDALDQEVGAVQQLGGEFRMGVRWGRDFKLADLVKLPGAANGGAEAPSFDAVFIGIGAQGAQGLRCAGEELALSGIGFLERVAAGDPPELGRRVVVLGGGNTAMDCARSAVRLGARVTVAYRRSRQEMPCLMEEVEGAEQEGVELQLLVAPLRLDREGGLLRLTCQRMALGEPDASGRRRPLAVKGSEFTIECDTVIAAIGQSVDRELATSEGVGVSSWAIAAHEHTMATNLPGVFAGGDAVLGADLAVRAVAAGRMAAASIHQYLNGEEVTGEPALAGIAMRPIDDEERATLFREIERSARTHVPELPIEQRVKTFLEVEARMAESEVESEAGRCLSCGCRKAHTCVMRSLATEYDADVYRYAGERRRFSQDLTHPELVYEPGKCVSCDACVRIAAAMGEPVGMAMIGRGFDVRVAPPFGKSLSEGLTVSAIRCAEACPTGALSLRTKRACELTALRV